MPIIACGINHKTASIELREKVVFSLEKMSVYLSDLLRHENIHEAVILSTCNRSEIYCNTDDSEKLLDWYCHQHQLSRAELEPALYLYEDKAAIAHIMQVACGIDSMVLGESQILGQMKDAFSESCAAGVIGPLFNRLFQQVFSVAKEVRSNTSIGACPVSVASASVGLAKQIVPELSAATVLVIGAGATVELLLRHLQTHSIASLIIANRNKEHAVTLASNYGGQAIAFSALGDALVEADIVISATGSALPVVTKAMMQKVLMSRQSKSNPIVMIDIAVPRDVEPTVSELASVHLYCIDDLKSIIQQNRHGREHAAEKAQEIIDQKSSDYIAWIHSLEIVSTTISAYRKQVEEICQAELAKAVRQLQRGEDSIQVLTSFSHAFTNKLLHVPCVQLRQAGFEGRFEILRLAQQLFAIPQVESEL
jgi:glutamyl-tRNA reductase